MEMPKQWKRKTRAGAAGQQEVVMDSEEKSITSKSSLHCMSSSTGSSWQK